MLNRYFHTPELKIMWLLTLPLILTGIVESSVRFTAMFFLAHLGPADLAAGSLVTWFFATLMIILWGVFMGVSVLVSHHDGAKQPEKAALVLRDGLYLSVILVIPSSILIWHLSPILILLGQNPATVKLAIPYMHALAWSPLPDFLSLCLLQFIIGLGHTKTNLIVTLCWVPVNILCNFIFIFGKFGFPQLGMAGLGWGTTVSYAFCVLVLVLYLLLDKRYRPYLGVFKKWSKSVYLTELFKIGLPIGLMWFVEVSFFFSLALIMGRYGLTVLDANQIAIQYVGFFVSISFAASQAITVRLGYQIGAQQFTHAKRVLYTGMIISVCCTLIPISFYWLAPQSLVNFDFSDAKNHLTALYQLITPIFAVAALFQLLEAVRLSLFGALRALKDTQFTLFTSFIAFWCISIPLGALLANQFHAGPIGYWEAMTFASACNIILLAIRYRHKIAALSKQFVI
jgi:MATE family multidrug resistance protein